MSIIALAIRVVLVGCFVGFFATSSHAEETKPSGNAAATPGTPATPVDDFGQEYKKFKEQLTALPKKIEDTSRSVEGKRCEASCRRRWPRWSTTARWQKWDKLPSISPAKN